MLKHEVFDDGIIIHGDCVAIAASQTGELFELMGEEASFKFPLIIADPPYGKIVNEDWDKINTSDEQFAKWMCSWTNAWARHLDEGAAFYVWGGIGRVGFRPFFRYISMVEEAATTDLVMSNMITWSKRRAYGVQHNYLFTREELAYFCNGDPKKPRMFNVPLLTVKRGYPGYNKKYPAKSEHKRRTNVWSDVTEIMRGKLHPTQKAQRVIEIPIEVHTVPGEWVLDPFAGCGTTALAARKLGRRFVMIEKDVSHFETMVEQLRKEKGK